MLQETGIKGERRGETLSLEEFAALSRSYARNRKEGVSDET
jgi:16S rRNA A1518/A1519 N6-dimethyltransferase RsmA/KsgA/DIM1 with predicted DNA glycosylase/AP lyase activity